jgi:hypothetical protein
MVGLILAFGLSLAVGRYETRRTTVVDEANAIGTTYLRAQTLEEPMRTASLERLRRYTDTTLRVAHAIPKSDAQKRAVADGEQLQRELWSLAGQSLDRAPQDSAPRLYVESLNETIDIQGVRVAGLSNRVPGAVLLLEVIGAAAALGLLSVYLSIVGRGVLTVVLAATLVSMILLVTFDLDRPTRGLITIPSAPLDNVRASMNAPPAAAAPTEP